MGYFGCNILRASATVLALACAVMGIFCLVSPSWLRQDLAKVTTDNFDKGNATYGLLSACYEIPAQARTGKVNIGRCNFYGKDLGSEWPTKPWAAAAVLMGISVIFSTVVFFGGVADMFTISSTDIFCSLSIGFAALCDLVVIFLFFGGIGGERSVDRVGTIKICSSGTAFHTGADCQLYWTFYLAVTSFLLAMTSSAFFALSGKAASGSGAYA
eukprot:comp38652_c0_seq1/m.47356 comp38652_c0_seq1/g.47356  ORF comp38652_c0_seq1/g.47356 comp38652_c0_seq1/m.47356 type:complete len:214 (-) comp38652_c0_seq1:170-811(-)